MLLIQRYISSEFLYAHNWQQLLITVCILLFFYHCLNKCRINLDTISQKTGFTFFFSLELSASSVFQRPTAEPGHGSIGAFLKNKQ